MPTNKDRIYVVLKKEYVVVVVEIKYSKEGDSRQKLEEAMLQIRENRYYEKYINNSLTLLAIVFSENKNIFYRTENI